VAKKGKTVAKKSRGSAGKAKRRASPGTATRRSSVPEQAAGEPGLTPENRRALAYIAALGACGFTLLALVSYEASDPAFTHRSTSPEVANWCGRWGANVADVLYQLVGWAAWAVAPLGGWLWLRFARRPAGSMIRFAMGVVGTWWFATFLGLLFAADGASYDAFPAGGVVGGVTAGWLLSQVGTVGSYVLVILVLLTTATVAFGIDWEELAERGVGAVETGTPRLGAVVWQGLLGWGRGLGAATLRGLARLRESLRRTPRWERDGFDEPLLEYTDEEPSLKSDPGVRRADPMWRPEPEVVFAGPARTEFAYDFSEEGLERVVPTAASPVELVEVEMDTDFSEYDIPPASVVETPLDAPVPHTAAEPTRHSVAVPTPVAPLKAPEAAPSPVGELDPFDAPEPTGLTRRKAAPPPAAASAVPITPGRLESGTNGRDDLLVRAPAPEEVFELPTLGLLDRHAKSHGHLDELALKVLAATLQQKLADFGIKGEVTAIRPGPVITIFEYLPAPGVKVASIARLQDDIAMAMKALRVRIVAPIPGKGVVGIEIPNDSRQTVWLRDVLASREFREGSYDLPMALGKTVEGLPFVADLARMPHVLVGGTTGSGKSVGINGMLMSLLFTRTPDELRLILIDPKMLEFEPYDDLPHLLHPVVTEPKLAAAALKWTCTEMDERYRLLARWGTRNIASYNKKVARELKAWTPDKARRYAPRGWPEDQPPPPPRKLPWIVVVIDELADLMMVAAKDVEASIVRLAQKARACGIHLIVATQRPSVDVITGLIKANMPSRIAFQVRSKTDGRTILDQNGAEALLGKGDMLYLPPGVSALERLHGPFVADDEVGRVADFLKDQGEPLYEAEILLDDEGGESIDPDDYDEVYDEAVQLVTEKGKASTSMIQRHLKIGYNRAARIMDIMEREGVVGPADGARPRQVLAPSHPSI